MIRHAAPRLAAVLLGAASLLPLPAMAEYLSPDWSGLRIKGVAEPDWIAGVRDGKYIGMCTSCDGTMMLEVQVLDDDGTGGRVRSGETTTDTYTKIGQTNAEQLGGDADYYGTEEISFGPGVGFSTSARTALGDYAITYQLWSDGKQLVVKVYGKDQAGAQRIAEQAFKAAAPLTFQ